MSSFEKIVNVFGQRMSAESYTAMANNILLVVESVSSFAIVSFTSVGEA